MSGVSSVEAFPIGSVPTHKFGMYEVVDGAVERSSNQRPPSCRVSHWNPDWHSLIPDPVSPNSWQPPAVSLAYLAVI